MGLSITINNTLQRGFPGGENISVPIGFTHTMSPFVLTYTNKGNITNKSLSLYRSGLISTIKYVKGTTGSDSANGDTAGTAYKTLSKALSVTCDRIVIMESGNYTTLANTTLTATKEIISTVANVVIGRGLLGSARTWVDDGGGMFHTTSFSLAVPVISDITVKDSNGVPSYLSVQTSSANCAANANSFYKDAGGSILYVHTVDGRQPDVNIFIVTDNFNVSAPASAFNVHFEGLTLLKGFKLANNTANKTTVTIDNCIICHDYSTDLLSLNGNCEGWIRNTIASGCIADNLNYKGATYNANIIEENIISYNAGIGAATGINNCSTSHNSCSVLRLNSEYYNAEGPCVHDVNSALSFNINCYSHDSLSSVAGNKSAFAVAAATSETAKMWLYRCMTRSGDTTYGAENRAAGTANIYGKKSHIYNVEPGTTVESY